MSRAINVFTSLVFIYSLIVCITCKQFSPVKVGAIEKQFSFTKAELKKEYNTSNTGDAEQSDHKLTATPTRYTLIKK
jgi:hypothetical protein